MKQWLPDGSGLQSSGFIRIRDFPSAEVSPRIHRARTRAAAAALRGAFDRGGRVLALGNGGSASDAMDLVADLASPPAARGWPARRALDLTADTAIITALVR